ncbi:MarR family winged helix-turn-helix transcriptional regulator [Rhodoferax sp.]|uniref:MarR family winged helix-turn-helix transcriptional regulator n=1 Tax=Rhodoferax sp. TaxID=50421 RepID=UPI0027314E33|nr:helix-turn-helix domain-containing protein [Rhodoferax sp.]MDP1530526.1 helix-turn-helix domain-containing protein [Rhodoferax sp.]MDP1944589.1 helix-turn-helix domain-containing protein [Rhodoferax sp.]MDP2440626.1 helix-turn-helix domain-containing protein [Rhodoferax sp.]MDZ4208947.1 helix-turn-helix domain-containing protein [Rhodoferax sp.]
MTVLSLGAPWRQTHMGYWLAQASARFDARVLALMAANDSMPLALANLAARGHLTASHVHITRHLALAGSRLTDLATSAGVSKQAMGKLVDQCEAWGLVQRQPDLRDARACQVLFTPAGLSWLQAFQDAVTQAQTELQDAVGQQVATVMALGLEAYAA